MNLTEALIAVGITNFCAGVVIGISVAYAVVKFNREN